MIHEFECKFCKEKVKGHSVTCPKCGYYQDESISKNKTKNKIKEINKKRLFNFKEAEGKTIKNVWSDFCDNSVIIFTDNSWISVSAELDPYSGDCTYRSAEISHSEDIANTKKDFVELRLWK